MAGKEVLAEEAHVSFTGRHRCFMSRRAHARFMKGQKYPAGHVSSPPHILIFLYLQQPLAYNPLRKLVGSSCFIFSFLFGLFGSRCFFVLAQIEHSLPGMKTSIYSLPI